MLEHTMEYVLPSRPGVYSIFCHVNKKFYVGGAVNVRNRVRGHVNALRKGRHSNTRLQRTWNKYGEGAFTTEVLERCTEGNVRAREQAWLDSVKESGTPVLNQHFRAVGTLGFRFSLTDEQRAKISASLRGNTSGRGNKGKPKTLAARAKMSLAHKGKALSSGHKAKLSEALRGNTHLLGHIHSPETRAKMSVASKGKPKSPEHRAKISLAKMGNTATLGKKHSAISRLKMSEARKKFWERRHALAR